MLKEVATLVVVLWCTHAFPTAIAPNKYKPTLDRLYCDAESLFGDYKNGKHLPHEMRQAVEKVFSGPNCNFTKAPGKREGCEIIQAYHELFARLNKTEHDKLLEPLMANHSFSSVIEYQGNYLKSHCPQGAQINVMRISYPNFNHQPSRQNMFYYIFEHYKNCSLTLWREQLTPEVDESNLCASK